MIRFVVDSSAIWRLARDDALRSVWSPSVSAGTIGSCDPQRIEFRRSARNVGEYQRMDEMFNRVYPDVPVPKTVWRWIEASQYRLLRAGVLSAFSLADLLICATAAHNRVVVLHDDNDFVVASRHLADVAEHRITDTPPADSSGAG